MSEQSTESLPEGVYEAPDGTLWLMPGGDDPRPWLTNEDGWQRLSPAEGWVTFRGGCISGAPQQIRRNPDHVEPPTAAAPVVADITVSGPGLGDQSHTYRCDVSYAAAELAAGVARGATSASLTLSVSGIDNVTAVLAALGASR